MLDVFGLFKVDTLYVVIGLLVITIAAIVLAIVAICKACAMTKKYEMMMEGSDGKSMEKMVRKYTDDIINLQKTSEDNTEAIKDIYEKMQLNFPPISWNASYLLTPTFWNVSCIFSYMSLIASVLSSLVF